GICRRLRLQQQVSLSQHLKKPVPTDFYSRGPQFGFQHLIKLATAHARLQLALPLNQFANQFGVHNLALPLLTSGVIVLAAHSHPPADRTDTNPQAALLACNAYVRRPPGCFFLNPSTSLMPARSQAICV